MASESKSPTTRSGGFLGWSMFRLWLASSLSFWLHANVLSLLRCTRYAKTASSLAPSCFWKVAMSSAICLKKCGVLCKTRVAAMSAQKLPAINHRSCKSFALSNDLWLLTLMSWKRCESQTVDNSTTRSEFGSYHGHNSTNICCICDELNLRGIGIFVGNFCCHQNCRELPSCCGLLPLNIAQCSYLKKGKRRRLCKNHISRHFSLLIILGNILNDWPWGNPCHRTVRMYRSSISKKSQTRRAGIPCFWYRKLLNPIQEHWDVVLATASIPILPWSSQALHTLLHADHATDWNGYTPTVCAALCLLVHKKDNILQFHLSNLPFSCRFEIRPPRSVWSTVVPHLSI